MADIQSYLDKIRTAESGESVRDAIINSLRDINNDDPNPRASSATFDMPIGSDLHMTGGPWNEITVRQAGSGGKTTNLRELTITENGVFPRDDPDYDPDTERVYYSKVTSKVPQMGSAIMEDVFEVTENGQIYYAENEGVDGFAAIKVNVSNIPVSGQFEVKFYGPDMTTVIDTQLVPAYGSASCTKLDGTTEGSKSFKGWNPSPTNITRDMKCYPVYGDIIIDPGEIQETWEQICADGGAHVPIGGYKNVVLTVYANADFDDPIAITKTYQSGDPSTIYDTKIVANTNNQLIFYYPYYMVKVAEGEDGSHSTWLSTGCATINGNFRWKNSAFEDEMSGTQMVSYYKEPFGNWPNAYCHDWETSAIRQLLNGKVFANLEPVLQNNIKAVTKYSRGINMITPDATRIQKQTLDKIWIPSMKELDAFLSTYYDISQIYPTSYNDLKEINGIDYSVNYAPTWPFGSKDGSYCLRTMGWYGSSQNSSANVLASWTVSGRVLIGSDVLYGAGLLNVPFGFCL